MANSRKQRAKKRERMKRYLKATRELPEEQPGEMDAYERDAVLDTFGEDGLFYEEMTGKQLGNK